MREITCFFSIIQNAITLSFYYQYFSIFLLCWKKDHLFFDLWRLLLLRVLAEFCHFERCYQPEKYFWVFFFFFFFSFFFFLLLFCFSAFSPVSFFFCATVRNFLFACFVPLCAGRQGKDHFHRHHTWIQVLVFYHPPNSGGGWRKILKNLIIWLGPKSKIADFHNFVKS